MRIISFTILLLFSQFLLAQNCYNNWMYFRSVSIHNQGDQNLNNIQIPIDLDAKSLLMDGKIQINGEDVRVTDQNCQLLPFYLGINAADSSESLWVKLASLPANDSVSLQLYYGNTSAESKMDGEATFIFFDDFSDTELDLEKWETVGGFATSSISNGIYEYASNGMNPGPRFKFVRTKMAFSEELEFDFRAKISNSNGFGFSSTDSLLDRIIYRQSGFGFDTLNQVAFNDDTLSNGVSISQEYPIIRFPRREFKDANIRVSIPNNILTTTRFNNLDDASFDADTFQVLRSPMSGYHFILSSFINASVFLDYLRVRKVLPEGISINIGEEEELIANSLSFPGSDQVIEIYPNPTKHILNLKGLEAGSYQLELMNAQSQIVYQNQSHTYGDGRVQLVLPQLPKGIFWLKITNQHAQQLASPILIQE